MGVNIEHVNFLGFRASKRLIRVDYFANIALSHKPCTSLPPNGSFRDRGQQRRYLGVGYQLSPLLSLTALTINSGQAPPAVRLSGWQAILMRPAPIRSAATPASTGAPGPCQDCLLPPRGGPHCLCGRSFRQGMFADPLCANANASSC